MKLDKINTIQKIRSQSDIDDLEEQPLLINYNELQSLNPIDD